MLDLGASNLAKGGGFAGCKTFAKLGKNGCKAFTHRADRLQIDHDIDNPVPHLPLRELLQDLHSTDPNQKTCDIACRVYETCAILRSIYHADDTGPIRRHELDLP